MPSAATTSSRLSPLRSPATANRLLEGVARAYAVSVLDVVPGALFRYSRSPAVEAMNTSSVVLLSKSPRTTSLAVVEEIEVAVVAKPVQALEADVAA